MINQDFLNKKIESESMFAVKKERRDNQKQSYYTYTNRLAEHVFKESSDMK